MSERKFYAVAHGFKRGVYEDWSEVQKQTNGFLQPVYKKFETREEAEKFVDSRKAQRIEYANIEEAEDATAFYAVARGKVVGVFLSYDEVKKHIADYPQPLQKKFPTYEEAKAYVAKYYEGVGIEKEKKGEEKEPAKKEKKEIEEKATISSVSATEARSTRSAAKGEKPKVFYAVARGHKTGVFTDWGECKEATTGFKGAKFKKFESEKEAKLFAEGKTLKQIEEVTKRKSDEKEGGSPPKKAKKA